MKKLNNPTENFVSRRINQRRVRRWVALLSALVLFLTVNTLKLEADTLERIATCGIEQHVHDESCYDASGALICGLAEHAHTDACFQQRPQRHDLTRVDGFMPLNAKVTLATPMPKLTSNSADGQDAVQAEADYYSDIPTEVGSGIEPPVDEIETELAGEDAAPAVEDAVPLEIVYEDQAEETVQQPEYVINGSTVLLSDILSALGMKVSGIQSAGELEGDTFAEDPVNFAVEATQNDYELRVLRDFDAAELGVVTADEVIVITLKNGIAPVEDSDDENPSENDDINIEETHTEETDEEAAAVETVDEEAEDSADELTENADDEETGEASDEATVDETEEEAVETVEETETAAVTPEKQIALDFADYDCLADATVYFYASDRAAVLVNAEELAEADGVHLTVNAPVVLSMEANLGLAELEAALEEAPEDIDARIGENPVLFENGVLIISGDGELTVNGVTYTVTNLTLPARSVESDNITISTVDDQATLLGVTPAFEDNGEDEGDIYALFAASMDEHIVTATSEEIQIDAIEPAKGLLRSSAMMATTDAAPEAEEAVADAEETVEETAETETAEAAVETRTLKVRVYDVSLIREGESVEPDAPIHVETTFDAPLEGENFQLYHIVDGKPEAVDGFVKTDDQGRAIGMSFDTASLSPFAVVYYTVEYEIVNGEVTVKVDFTDIVQNGVDFDENDVITALNDGVGVSIAELEQGYTEGTDNVVYGELSVDYTTADNKDSLVQKSWGLMDVVSADDGLTVENGEIRVTADGTVVLSDGKSTINIKITGYQASVQKVLGDGATIEALGDTELPMGASASYEDLSEKADELAEKYGLTNENAVEGFSAFDVGITTPSGEYDAEGSFAVTVSHEVAIPEGAKVELFHIHEVDGEKQAELVENATVEDGRVSFVTDGFSEYVVRYTVEFHNGDEEVVIEGGSQILLSELIERLDIRNEAGERIDVVDVVGVEFTTDELVNVEQVSGVITYHSEEIDVGEKDFLLTSEQPFDETAMIIHMADEDIRLRVTDAITDLGAYLKDVSITGTEMQDGKPKVKEGVPYTVDLKFGVKNSVLFNQAAETMTFTALEGFTPSDTSGTLTISGNRGDVKLDYTVSNGVLTIHWQDMDSDAFKAFADTEYSEFELRIDGEFTQNNVKFTNTVTKEVVVDTTKGLAITKSGTYNPKTNAIDYTVTVTADGPNTDVHIGDTITGTALTYNNDLVVTSNKGSVSYTSDQVGGETFGIKVGSMAHGETITLKYSAAVNLADVTGQGTVQQTGNTANTKSKEDTTPHEAHTQGDWLANKISASTIGKSAGNATVENGKTYIPWTITVNEAANVSMAGVKVSDMITTPDIMRYYGSGIHIEKYNTDGSPAGSSDVAWGSMISKTDSAWTYQIPAGDTGNYKYVITYYTEVDSDNIIAATSVGNTASYDYNGGSTAPSGKQVEPTGETVDAEKNAVETIVDAKDKTAQTTWEVKFTVPSRGLDSCVVTDTYPVYSADASIKDTLKADSIVVTPELLSGERVAIDTSDPTKAVLTFYKTVNGNETTGLNGTGAEREITVRLTTECNPTWATFEQQWQKNHVNNATVNVNGQDIKVSANVDYDFTEKTLTKLQTANGKLHVDAQEVNYPPYHIDEHDLPAFEYEIKLTGITEATFANGPLVITDTFDPTYVTFNPNTTDVNGNNHNGSIFGGNVYYAYSNEKLAAAIPTLNGNTLTFTLKDSDLPKNSGNYYDIYTIRYYLNVKDRETLAKMNRDALNNEGVKVSFDNTASAENFGSSTVTTDYETDVLTKSFVDKGTTGGNGYEIEFTLDVNPNAQKIGDSDTITLTDTYKNLSLDYATITIDPDDDVNVNRRGSSIIFTLKNETHYTIKYTSRVLGVGQITWSNEANLEGQKESTSKTVTSSGSGSSTAYNMKVLKHADGNIRQGLQAKFDLYERKDGGAWSKIYSFETDPATGEFDIQEFPGNAGNRRLRRYSHHNASGDEVIDPDNEGYEYYIVETRAPAGYTLDTTHYMFRISDVADYSTWTFLNNDIVAIVNKPSNDVSVEKTWVNPDGTETWPAGTSVTFTLKKKRAADGTVSDLTQSDLGKKWTGFQANKTLTAAPTGPLWEALPALPDGYSYVVVESAVTDYTSYAKDEDGNYKLTDTAVVNGNVASFANTATPPTVRVDVEKVWDPQPETPAEAKVTVQLKRSRTLVFGEEDAEQQAITEAGAENYGDSVEIEYDNTSEKWAYAFENLPKFGAVTVDGRTLYYEYAYEVEEVSATLNGEDASVFYNRHNTVVTPDGDNQKVSISNSHEETYNEETQLKVTAIKRWKDSSGNIITDSSEIPQDAQVKLALRRYMSYEAPDPDWALFTGSMTVSVEGTEYSITADSGDEIRFDFELTGYENVNVNKKESWGESWSGQNYGLGQHSITFTVSADGSGTKVKIDNKNNVASYTLTNLTHPSVAATVTLTEPDTTFNTDNVIAVDLPFGGQWSKVFPVQPKTGTATISGEQKAVTYSYYVEEIDTAGKDWTVEYDKDSDNNITAIASTGSVTVTNVLPKRVTAVKEWKNDLGAAISWPQDGGVYSPASIDVKLQRRIGSGEFEDVDGMTATIYPEEDAANGHHTIAEFNDLELEDASHHPYEYRVVEATDIPGYASEVTDEGNGHFVITNAPAMSMTVEKTWDAAIDPADQPNAVQFTLYQQGANDELTKVDIEGNPMVLVAQGEGSSKTWGTVVLDGLPKYGEGSTEPITYVIKETGVYFGALESGNLPDNAQFVTADLYDKTGDGTVTFVEDAANVTIANAPISKDVPLEKSWVDETNGNFEGSKYNWWAEFVLEKLEVLESGEPYVAVNPSEGPAHEWTPVDGTRKRLEKGESLVFPDLPVYKVYPNGSVYRIEYSVDEVAYEVTKNGTVLSSRDEEYPNDASKNKGDTKYSPSFIQDAGEFDELRGTEDWYKIIVSNTVENITRKADIDLGIQKVWEDGSLNNPDHGNVSEDDAWARFELIQYKKEIYRDYSGVLSGETQMCTVNVPDFINNTGTPISSITVPKGAKVYIQATFKSGDAGNGQVTFKYNNHDIPLRRPADTRTVHSYSVDTEGWTVTQDFTFSVEQGQYLESVEVVDSKNPTTQTETVLDTFILRKNPGAWQKSWTDLVTLEEDEMDVNGNQTAYQYSYAFREVESNPSGFGAAFTDIETNNALGDAGHQVSSNATIKVENKPIPPFRVKKEWHDNADPDNYPEIRFSLYQGTVSGGKVQVGHLYVDSNGKTYENIPLNPNNNWTWDCPVYLPTSNEAGNPVGYYVVESTTGTVANIFKYSTFDSDGNVVTLGDQINFGSGEKYDVSPWDYYNDQNTGHGYTGTSGQLPVATNGGFEGNTGTLYIVNRVPKYKQMDIKKKILLVNPEDGSVDTVMDHADVQQDIVLELQLMRRVIDARTGTDVFLTDWEEYGEPFMIGFDHDHNPIQYNPNPFTLVKQGGFFWRIVDERQENGLPAYGYYNLDGEIIPVRYRYIPFELNIWSDLERHPYREGFEWFKGLQPHAWDGDGSEVAAFAPMLPNHDQDRIKNIQASDVYVEKVWEDTASNIEEVYVKIYRSRGVPDPTKGPAQVYTTGENGEKSVVIPDKNTPQDFTPVIADRTDEFSGYGFVEDADYLSTIAGGVLVMKNGSDPIHIHSLPLVYDDDNYLSMPYYYWIEEVGYKTKDGIIYLADEDVERFDPKYDKWDATAGGWTGNWTSNPWEAAVSLGRMGRNRLKASNRPFIDIRVYKEWYDEDGNKLTGPWTDANVSSIEFKVKQTATKYVNGQPTDVTGSKMLTFSGSDTLKIESTAKRARVKPTAPGSSTYTVEYLTGDEQAMVVKDQSWMTYVDGLEEIFVDGVGDEWHFTYEVTESTTIEHCDTKITSSVDGYGITTTLIKNKKIVTSLAIEKVFAGNAAGNLTDEQKKTITFTVTGPNDYNETFNYGVSDPARHATWEEEDGTLVIKQINSGEYNVTENHATPGDLFTAGSEGADYTYSVSYTVGTTTDENPVSATVNEGELTRVTVTNTYEKAKLIIKKTIGGDLDALPEGKTITFTVSPAIGSQTTFTYPTDFTAGTLTLTQKDGVKPDTVYTVTESSDMNLTGYTRTTLITSGDGEPVTKSQSDRGAIAGKDTTDADDYTAEVDFENDYVQRKIEIPVEKIWEHESGDDTWPSDVTVDVTLYKQIGDTAKVFVESHTLTETETSYTFKNQPEYEDETLISYSVDEEVHVPTGSTLDPDKYQKIVTGDPDDGFTITNKEQSNGALKIKKLVTVNDENPATEPEKALVDGEYIFTVVGPSDATNKVTKYVQITVSGGVQTSYKISDANNFNGVESTGGDWAVVSELNQGDYVITETGTKEGVTLKVAARGDNKTEAVDLDKKQVTVHVTAGDNIGTDAQATFTNNCVDLDQIEATKAWTSGETTLTAWPEDVDSVTFTLYASVDGGTAAAVEKNAYPEWRELTELTKTVDALNDAGKASWSDLPKKVTVSGEKKPVVYSVVETLITYKDNSTQEVNKAAVSGVVTNEATTEISGTKTWADVTTPLPRGTTATIGLYTVSEENYTAYPADEQLTVTLDGTQGTAETGTAPYGYKEAAWKATFKNLPKYNADGTVITYAVRETGFTYNGTNYTVTNGTTVTPTGFAVTQDDNAITNTELTQITVEKSWGSGTWPEDVTVDVEWAGNPDPNPSSTDHSFDNNGSGHSTLNSTVTSATKTGLPKYADVVNDETNESTRQLIAYTVKEVGIKYQGVEIGKDQIDAYFDVTGPTLKDGTETTYVITNTPKTVSVGATKVWDLVSGQGTAVQVKLFAGENTEPVAMASMDGIPDVTEDDTPEEKWTPIDANDETKGSYRENSDWHITFKDLPKYEVVDDTETSGKKFQEINYKVVESGFTAGGKEYTVTVDAQGVYTVKYNDSAVGDFTVTATGDMTSGYTITNTEKTQFEFTKEWYENFETAAENWPRDDHDQYLPITVELTRRLKYDTSTLSQSKDAATIVLQDLTPETSFSITGTYDNSAYTVTMTEVVQDRTGKVKFTITGLPAKGSMTIDGTLKNGTWVYEIEETNVDSEYKVSYIAPTDGIAKQSGTTIRNEKMSSYTLPSTGGPGTTVFYVLGSILTLLAAVLLITKKRTDGQGIE